MGKRATTDAATEATRAATRPEEPARTAGANGHASLARETLLEALTAFGKGDFSVRLPEGLDGLDGRIARAFNDVIGKTEEFTEDLERLSGSIEQAGALSARLSANGYRGNWASMVS